MFIIEKDAKLFLQFTRPEPLLSYLSKSLELGIKKLYIINNLKVF